MWNVRNGMRSAVLVAALAATGACDEVAEDVPAAATPPARATAPVARTDAPARTDSPARTNAPARTDAARTQAASLIPLPAALVGVWTQSNYSGSLAGSYQRRALRFQANATYEYWNEWCPSYNNCSGPYERGYARVSGGTLVLMPTTQSAEGLRSFPFEVVRDLVGTLTLRLTTQTYDDVFYRSG